jgi:integrase/recombinase XerD
MLGIGDIDAYFEMRAPGLRRRSLKDVAERLRSLTRYLHRTGRTAADLAPQIIAPTLYLYETIPSAPSPDEISAVLKTTREDRSPMGLRDYAILLLLSTYGMRAGEITRLRLEDIDWRAETLHIRHSKTGAHSLLPLLRPTTTRRPTWRPSARALERVGGRSRTTKPPRWKRDASVMAWLDAL